MEDLLFLAFIAVILILCWFFERGLDGVAEDLGKAIRNFMKSHRGGSGE